MLQLNKSGMKILTVLHYVAMSFWLGSAAVLILLTISNKTVMFGEMLGIATAIHLADTKILIPGALGCLATGFVFALFTPWRFFKHRWLVCKWILTTACILTGTFFLGVWEAEMLSISRSLGDAALADSTYQAVRAKYLLLSCMQFCALLLIVGISVFRPWKKSNRF